MADQDRTEDAGTTRGPLDPRLFRLAPALRTHVVLCLLGAVVTAAAILTIAESVGRYLPEMLAGDRSVVTPFVTALVVAGMLRGAAIALVEESSSRAVIGTRTSLRNQVLDHLELVASEVASQLR